MSLGALGLPRAPTLEIIDVRTAVAALLANAFVDPDDGCNMIHSFRHDDGMMLGADVSLEYAIELVDEAEKIAWVDHPAGHDLGVLSPDGRSIYFRCFRERPADRARLYR